MVNKEKSRLGLDGTLANSVPYVSTKAAYDVRSRAPLRGRRGGLLAGAAVGAICLASLPTYASPDVCAVSGNEATCVGNQSSGIEWGTDFIGGVDLLVIENLTHDIAPTNRSDGVRAVGIDRSINILANTGSNFIVGDINGYFLDGSDSILLDHTGNIRSQAYGVRAYAWQTSGNAGDVSINARGYIESTVGIYARSDVSEGDGNSGNVVVSFEGTMNTQGDSVDAQSYVSRGNGNSGRVIVDTKGAVGGIRAISRVLGDGNSGDVTVSHEGSQPSGGISATSSVKGAGNAGVVAVSSSGGVVGYIQANSVAEGIGNSGSSLVQNTGDITNAGLVPAISATSDARVDGNSGIVGVACQSARKVDPGSASKIDPLVVHEGERPTGWSWSGLRSPVGRVGQAPRL